MKKYTILALFLCLSIFSVMFASCQKEEKVPPAEVSSLYDEFLRILAVGPEEKVDMYLYYDKPEYKQLSEGAFEPSVESRILRWEELNNSLWSVTTYIRTENQEEGIDCFHFVGIVDGSWKVMIGKHNIPDDLSAGLDLSRFSYEDELPMEDIQFEPVQ